MLWRTCWGRRKPSKAAVINWLSPFAKGLVASWPFNDGPGSAYVKNYALGGGAGTLIGFVPATDWVGAEGDMVLQHDAIQDRMDVYGVPALRFASTGASILIDVDITTCGQDGMLCSWSVGTSWRCEMGKSHGWATRLVGGGNKDELLCTITDGARNQFVFVWDSPSKRIYKNGVLHASNVAGHGAGNLGLSDADQVWIAYDADFKTGYIGKTRRFDVYNRALSTEEVAWLYRHPYCMYMEPVHAAWWETAGGGVHELAGTMQAELTGTGTLTRRRQLAGSLVAELTGSGSLTRQRHLAAIMVAELIGAGTPTRARGLAGEILIELVSQGDLRRARALAGALAAELTGTGALKRGRALHGELSAELTGTGALTRERHLVGEMLAELILTGSIAGFGIEVILPLHLAMLERHGIHVEDLQRISTELRQIGRSGIHGKR